MAQDLATASDYRPSGYATVVIDYCNRLAKAASISAPVISADANGCRIEMHPVSDEAGAHLGYATVVDINNHRVGVSRFNGVNPQTGALAPHHMSPYSAYGFDEYERIGTTLLARMVDMTDTLPDFHDVFAEDKATTSNKPLYEGDLSKLIQKACESRQMDLTAEMAFSEQIILAKGRFVEDARLLTQRTDLIAQSSVMKPFGRVAVASTIQRDRRLNRLSRLESTLDVYQPFLAFARFVLEELHGKAQAEKILPQAKVDNPESCINKEKCNAYIAGERGYSVGGIVFELERMILRHGMKFSLTGRDFFLRYNRYFATDNFHYEHAVLSRDDVRKAAMTTDGDNPYDDKGTFSFDEVLFEDLPSYQASCEKSEGYKIYYDAKSLFHLFESILYYVGIKAPDKLDRIQEMANQTYMAMERCFPAPQPVPLVSRGWWQRLWHR